MLDHLALDDNTNLCLSGGATGADLQWGMCAGQAGHMVIHWSFDGHNILAPKVETVELTTEQLAEANPMLKLAAKSLGKNVPGDGYVKRLLQRNFYQVNWSKSLYAVSTMKYGQVQGGTSWAVQMYLDRKVEHQAYVYDQANELWLRWSDEHDTWQQIDTPPPPKGIWAGIGTRELNPAGKQAIRSLMGYVKPL